MQINSIAIIGKGNVATRYFYALKEKGFQVGMVSSRESFSLNVLKSDLIIIAVKDEAITQVAKSLGRVSGIVVHTSGFVETTFLAENADVYGSFYPLQTLKKDIEIDFSNVPLCTYANTIEGEDLLKSLALKLTTKHFSLSDSQRRTLHLGAVFANNFTNHLFGIAKEILEKEEIPFETLFPLMEVTLSRVKENNPFDVQTGPAFREEISIMQEHVDKLPEDRKEIYKLLSNSIIKQKNKYNEKTSCSDRSRD